MEKRRILKKEMLKRKIKIVHNESSENFTYFTFYVGQKEQHSPYLKSTLTRHVKNVVDELTRKNHAMKHRGWTTY